MSDWDEIPEHLKKRILEERSQRVAEFLERQILGGARWWPGMSTQDYAREPVPGAVFVGVKYMTW